MEHRTANPFTRMSRLDESAIAYTVTVTTMAHQLFRKWTVLVWDENWLILRNPNPDKSRAESDAPIHIPCRMITSLAIHTD